MDANTIGWKVFEVLSPVLLAGLSWLSVKAAQLITAKVKNDEAQVCYGLSCGGRIAGDQ